MSTIQVFVSYKKEIPDTASLTAFEDGGDNFVATAGSKYSPFTGQPTKPIGTQTLSADKASLASIVTIGKCKCGSIHRADIASVSGMLDVSCDAFYCMDCGASVPLDVKMAEYLSASSEVNSDDDDTSDGKVSGDTTGDNSDDDTGADSDDGSSDSSDAAPSVDTKSDDSNGSGNSDDNTDTTDADVIDDTDNDDGDGDDDDDDDDDSENKDVDTNVKGDADADSASLFGSDEDFDLVVAALLREAGTDIGSSFEELAADDEAVISDGDDTDTDDGDIDDTDTIDDTMPETDVNPDSEEGTTVAPNLDDDTSTAPVANPDSAKGLFTGKDENPEGKTFADVIDNPIGADDSADDAHLVRLDRNVNFKIADIACVLDSKKTAYLVFADNKPVGTLSRARTHVDNAKLFEEEVFTRAFSSQIANGLDVSRFGYAPYTVKVDTKGIRKNFTDKQKADIASGASVNFDKRIDTIKTSLVTVATAANKGVWSDYANPIRNALVAKLTAIGVEDSAAIVDKVFVETAGVYVETLLTKAIDLANKPAAVREEFKRTVDTANYIVAPSNGNKLAARLASLGVPSKEETVVNTFTKPRLVGNSDTAAKQSFDWGKAFTK